MYKDSRENNDNIEDKLTSSDLIVVSLWAPWCQSCKTIKDTLKEIKKKYINKIKIFEFKIQKNDMIVQKYNVKGIPTLMFFKKGKNIINKTGTLQISQIETIINECL